VTTEESVDLGDGSSRSRSRPASLCPASNSSTGPPKPANKTGIATQVVEDGFDVGLSRTKPEPAGAARLEPGGKLDTLLRAGEYDLFGRIALDPGGRLYLLDDLNRVDRVVGSRRE
jgi:hypothetical protein